MDKGKSLQVFTDLLADMNACVIQDNHQMPFSKSLSQLGKKPYEGFCITMFRFFPVESFCAEIQAPKECEFFPFGWCWYPLAATFFFAIPG